MKFVIHEHQSSHHHFDFRLEVDGVFKSWAVPKGPSMNPENKQLAIQVDDHPLSYGSYEGIIPKGNYGAGPVVIWDQGTYKALDNNTGTQLKNGRLSFRLYGKKLTGAFRLKRIGQSNNKWLLIKKLDEQADQDWKLKTGLTPKKLKSLRVKTPPGSLKAA